MPANQQDDLAASRAEPSVLQFAYDTGMIPSGDIQPGTVEDGLLTRTIQTRSLYQREERLYLGPNRVGTVDAEAELVTGFVQLVPGLESSKGRPKGKAALTADQAAGTLVVQLLADAGYLNGNDFGSAKAGDPIQPGAVVDNWVAAHGNDPLKPGVAITVAMEKQRALAHIAEPVVVPTH